MSILYLERAKSIIYLWEFFNKNLIIRFNIVLDSKYNVINRTVYSMTDMFGQIGGMDSILVSAGSIIVGIFSSKMFTASLLSSFYYVNSDQHQSKILPRIMNEEIKEPTYRVEYKAESVDEIQIQHDQNSK